jgi:hypothetical protein
MRQTWKGQAKLVDEVTACLNLTFCHSRDEALRQARKPDAPVISRRRGMCHFDGRHFLSLALIYK